LRGEREDAERTPHRERERNGEFYSKLADSIRAPDYLLLVLWMNSKPQYFPSAFILPLSWAGFPSLAIDCRDESSYFAQKSPVARVSQWSQPAAREKTLWRGNAFRFIFPSKAARRRR
jgi:hypothetical protein